MFFAPFRRQRQQPTCQPPPAPRAARRHDWPQPTTGTSATALPGENLATAAAQNYRRSHSVDQVARPSAPATAPGRSGVRDDGTRAHRLRAARAPG